jgi:hypothetical protein
MKSVLHAVVAIFFGLAGCQVLASEYAGVVKTARGNVSLERSGARIAATPGGRVHQGDRIVTAADGYVGITMSDDTLLTLGPGSDLVLDTYGFDPKTHEGSFLASLAKGALLVVTGLIARRSPDSFAVKTRVSTMGVRGTEFIVEAYER